MRGAGHRGVLAGWSASQPPLAGFTGLAQIVAGISTDEAGRDAILLALLELAQDGDRLAGRVVLQAMLGRAVRVASSIVRRPDVAGDRDEAQAVAVAALWQAISTYRLAARPRRVAANLALDTLALVQRGHLGSSYRLRAFPEWPCADPAVLARRAAHYDIGPDELAGPVDAELCMLLAWGCAAACSSWTRPGCSPACMASMASRPTAR